MGATAQRAGAVAAARLGFDSNPFSGIEFSPAFIGFCGYMYAIITYRYPIGTVSMTFALLTLPLEKQVLRLPAVAVLSLAMVLWSFVGLTTTLYPDIVITAASDLAKITAVIFVAANVLTTRARFRAFIVGSIILFGMYPIRGTMFGYFLYGGAQGRAAWNYIYSNPNDLAAFCLLQLSVALGMMVVEKRRWVQLGARFAVTLLVIIIILTQSRGAVIALVAFGVIGGRKYLRNLKAVVSIVLLAILIYLVAPDSAWRRFSTIKDATSTEALDAETTDLATRQDQGSSQQRLAIWSVATALIAKNPISGVGLGAYPEAHYVQALRPGSNPTAYGKRDTHSTYLNLMAELGIPGFLLFAAMIIITLRTSYSARKKMQAKAPVLALQLFYLEVGLYGYLVAAIWGTYGALVPTYVHLVAIHVAARLLLEHEESMNPMVGRRRMISATLPPPVTAAAHGRSVGASA
jgi:O-antigen ligase